MEGWPYLGKFQCLEKLMQRIFYGAEAEADAAPIIYPLFPLKREMLKMLQRIVMLHNSFHDELFLNDEQCGKDVEKADANAEKSSQKIV